jgi:prepilin-type N-terminal cleavage/methylation domain-containing protein
MAACGETDKMHVARPLRVAGEAKASPYKNDGKTSSPFRNRHACCGGSFFPLYKGGPRGIRQEGNNSRRGSFCFPKNPNGFTLIEIIMAITMMGVLGLFSINYLVNLTQMSQQSIAQKDLMDQAKVAMEYLIREMRFANHTTVAITGGTSVSFTKLVPMTKDTSLNVTYTFSGGTLQRITTAAVTMATGLTAFNINSPSSDLYDISMTLQGANGENYTLVSSVRPRSSTG